MLFLLNLMVSIDRHKDISFNASTLLHKDTDNSYYGSFSIISKANADEEEYSAEYITNNNIIITLYVRRPRLYWQIWCNEILEQKTNLLLLMLIMLLEQII